MRSFWHIQMNLGLTNGSRLSQDQVLSMVKDVGIIGTGEWKDKKQDQCRQFKVTMRIGDIVMVRNGMQPLALVEILSNSYPNRTYENERSINVLSLFNEEISKSIGKYNGQAQGTLTIIQNKNSPTAKFIFSWYNLIIKLKEMDSLLSLIKYKKQIILQGPPGTGKTRLAKEVSLKAISDDVISDIEFSEIIYPGLTIQSFDCDESIKVTSIVGDTVRVFIKSIEKNYPVYFREIRKRIKKGDWMDNEGKNKNDYMTLLALHVLESYRDKQVKLLQFHPAYSYDDFVRGIVVDTSNGTVSYRSINKVFGDLAAKAWKNYLDSKKTPVQLSEEQKVDQFIDLFRDYLEEEIESKGGKLFLEGTTTYLFQVDEDAVRYTGNNWKLNTGQRLLFSDIKTLFLSGSNSRKDVKSNSGVSGLAKQHASYFVRVLNLFKEFVQGKSISNFENKSVELQNFVLIIDEINRANLPSVLGELIYGLEYRGESVESMYEVDGSRSMVIPPNLYIIGTMNTADRSVGHIDYAIRRRFAFVDVQPSDQPIQDVVKDPQTQAKALELFGKVSSLFQDEFLNSDFKAEEVQLGHSYFLAEDEAKLKLKLDFEIKPLLKEYIKDGILNEKALNEIEKL